MPQADDPVVVYVGTAWQAGQVQGILEGAGVESFLRDEVMGRIDAPALRPGAMGAVKVVVAAEHAGTARDVLRGFDESAGGAEGATERQVPPEPAWYCRACGQEVEAQFDVCWNCGAARGD